MDYEEERVSASSQEREMLIYVSKFGKNYTTWQEGTFRWNVEHVKAHRMQRKDPQLLAAGVGNGR